MLVKTLKSLALISFVNKYCYRTNQLKKNFDLRFEVAFGNPIKDHQYSLLISEDISVKDVKSAMHILLQSYFNNVVLDIETFTRLFELLEQ